jgi:hypothetical protein
MKFSRADSLIGRFIRSDVSKTDTVLFIRAVMTMEAKSVSETSDFINLLTRLSARENFIEFLTVKVPRQMYI